MSIVNFEEQTHELTAYEIERVLPLVVAKLKNNIGEDLAVTSGRAMKYLKERGYRINGPRWRKIINHIRINSLIPGLISTSKGYFVAENEEELRTYLLSLKQRINSITTVYDSMEYQLRQLYENSNH